MVRKSSRNIYTGFSLQKERVKAIKEYMAEHPELNYHSVIDFINDAINEKINKKVTVVKSNELKLLADEVFKISGEIKRLSGIIKEENPTPKTEPAEVVDGRKK